MLPPFTSPILTAKVGTLHMLHATCRSGAEHSLLSIVNRWPTMAECSLHGGSSNNNDIVVGGRTIIEQDVYIFLAVVNQS